MSAVFFKFKKKRGIKRFLKTFAGQVEQDVGSFGKREMSAKCEG